MQYRHWLLGKPSKVMQPQGVVPQYTIIPQGQTMDCAVTGVSAMMREAARTARDELESSNLTNLGTIFQASFLEMSVP
jgi:hypothetical protein